MYKSTGITTHARLSSIGEEMTQFLPQPRMCCAACDNLRLLCVASYRMHEHAEPLPSVAKNMLRWFRRQRGRTHGCAVGVLETRSSLWPSRSSLFFLPCDSAQQCECVCDPFLLADNEITYWCWLV